MRMVINLGELRIVTNRGGEAAHSSVTANRRNRLPPIVGTNYSQPSGQNAANHRNALVKNIITEGLKIEIRYLHILMPRLR